MGKSTLFLVLCTVDDPNYFFNLRKNVKYCKLVELFLKGRLEHAQKVLLLKSGVYDNSGANKRW